GQEGGIFNGGTMSIDGGTIQQNSAVGFVGGIFNAGTLSLSNTAVFDNSGALGMRNSGIATLTNVTLSGNSSQTLYNDPASTLTLLNVTIANSAGTALSNSGTTSLKNVLIANNGSLNCGGAVTSHGHNLST